MPRFYLRLAILPLIVFTAALSLIHAQPYDDHELRQLLLPEGCPAPCFMGIRPGVTTVEEAMKLLETSNWTTNVKLIENTLTKTPSIEWNWSDSAPTILNRQLKNDLEQSYSATQFLR